MTDHDEAGRVTAEQLGGVGAVPAPGHWADGALTGHAICNTRAMKKNLPEAVKVRPPTEKIVWMYIDRFPGEHSVRSLHAALGVNAGRAFPALLADGLLIEEEAPAGSRLGKYRAAELPDQPKPKAQARAGKSPKEKTS